MAALMGKEAHVGSQLVYGNRQRFTIIGIVKDFLFNDMYASSISPLIINCNQARPGQFGFMEIKLKAGNNLPDALAKVESVIKAGNPAIHSPTGSWMRISRAFSPLKPALASSPPSSRC
jgi:putative ABC transport system permease protein